MKRVLSSLAVSIILATSALAVEQPKTDTTMKVVKDSSMKDSTMKDISMKDSTMKNTSATKPAVETPWTTNKSGLKWRNKIVGKGVEAKMNMPVNCHYTVWLSDKDGKKGKLVQSSKDSQSLKCTIGQNLIQGWSEGMVGMKEGGTRELIVPPAIGYGNQAKGDMIPANSILYFEIEFLNQVKQ